MQSINTEVDNFGSIAHKLQFIMTVEIQKLATCSWWNKVNWHISKPVITVETYNHGRSMSVL
jgi:hypothetical protein